MSANNNFSQNSSEEDANGNKKNGLKEGEIKHSAIRFNIPDKEENTGAEIEKGQQGYFRKVRYSSSDERGFSELAKKQQNKNDYTKGENERESDIENENDSDTESDSDTDTESDSDSELDEDLRDSTDEELYQKEPKNVKRTKNRLRSRSKMKAKKKTKKKGQNNIYMLAKDKTKKMTKKGAASITFKKKTKRETKEDPTKKTVKETKTKANKKATKKGKSETNPLNKMKGKSRSFSEYNTRTKTKYKNNEIRKRKKRSKSSSVHNKYRSLTGEEMKQIFRNSDFLKYPLSITNETDKKKWKDAIDRRLRVKEHDYLTRKRLFSKNIIDERARAERQAFIIMNKIPRYREAFPVTPETTAKHKSDIIQTYLKTHAAYMITESLENGKYSSSKKYRYPTRDIHMKDFFPFRKIDNIKLGRSPSHRSRYNRRTSDPRQFTSGNTHALQDENNTQLAKSRRSLYNANKKTGTQLNKTPEKKSVEPSKKMSLKISTPTFAKGNEPTKNNKRSLSKPTKPTKSIKPILASRLPSKPASRSVTQKNKRQTNKRNNSNTSNVRNKNNKKGKSYAVRLPGKKKIIPISNYKKKGNKKKNSNLNRDEKLGSLSSPRPSCDTQTTDTQDDIYIDTLPTRINISGNIKKKGVRHNTIESPLPTLTHRNQLENSANVSVKQLQFIPVQHVTARHNIIHLNHNDIVDPVYLINSMNGNIQKSINDTSNTHFKMVNCVNNVPNDYCNNNTSNQINDVTDFNTSTEWNSSEHLTINSNATYDSYTHNGYNNNPQVSNGILMGMG